MLVVRVYLRAFKQVVRSPARISLIIAFPLLFTLVFAFIFGGGEFLDTSTSYSIGIINNDIGSQEGGLDEWRNDFLNYTKPWCENSTIDPLTHGFGYFFIESLQGKTSMKLTSLNYRVTLLDSVDQAIESTKSRAIQLAIKITPDFSYGILSGINSREQIVNGSPIVISSIIGKKNVTLDLIGDPIFTKFQDVRTDVEKSLSEFKTLLYGLTTPAGYIEVNSQSVSSFSYSNYDFFIAGFFTFGLVLSSGAIAGILGEERSQGTLNRLKISEMKPHELLAGITLNQFTVGAIQILVMFTSAYLFGFKGTGNPISAYLVVLITIIPVLGLGFLVSAYVPDGRDAMGVVSILSAPIGFLSGAFLTVPDVPLIENLVPTGTGTLRALQLWDFFPFSSSVSALRKILLFNYSLDQVFWDLVFLIIGGLIFFIFGLVFFTRRVFNPEK